MYSCYWHRFLCFIKSENRYYIEIYGSLKQNINNSILLGDYYQALMFLNTVKDSELEKELRKESKKLSIYMIIIKYLLVVLFLVLITIIIVLIILK